MLIGRAESDQTWSADTVDLPAAVLPLLGRPRREVEVRPLFFFVPFVAGSPFRRLPLGPSESSLSSLSWCGPLSRFPFEGADLALSAFS